MVKQPTSYRTPATVRILAERRKARAIEAAHEEALCENARFDLNLYRHREMIATAERAGVSFAEMQAAGWVF